VRLEPRNPACPHCHQEGWHTRTCPDWQDTVRRPLAAGQKGNNVATSGAKVHRVEISKARDGWKVQPTDAQGKVKLPGTVRGYARRDTARRGARRRFGANVKIAYV
jgi:hypothetical protein